MTSFFEQRTDTAASIIIEKSAVTVTGRLQKDRGKLQARNTNVILSCKATLPVIIKKISGFYGNLLLL